MSISIPVVFTQYTVANIASSEMNDFISQDVSYKDTHQGSQDPLPSQTTSNNDDE